MILTCTIRFPLLNATEIVRKMLNFIYVRSIYIFFFFLEISRIQKRNFVAHTRLVKTVSSVIFNAIFLNYFKQIYK